MAFVRGTADTTGSVLPTTVIVKSLFHALPWMANVPPRASVSSALDRQVLLRSSNSGAPSGPVAVHLPDSPHRAARPAHSGRRSASVAVKDVPVQGVEIRATNAPAWSR